MKIKWIDVMKGIGIVFVVAGHIYIGEVRDFIFLFHMPLFFYVSGFLFKKQENKREYFNSKLIHLGVPYISYIVLLYFCLRPLNPFSHNIEEVYIYFLTPLLGGEKMISVFWFVTVLFLTQQLFNFLVLNVSNKGWLNLIIFISLIFSYVNSRMFYEFRVPWNANVVLAALPFFMLGYYDKLNTISNKIILLLGLSLLFVLPLLIYFQNFSYDFKYGQYGTPFLTFYTSSVIVLIIKKISGLISKQKVISYLFTKLGESSIVVMFIHFPIKDLLSKLEFSNSLNLLLSLLISYLFYKLFTLNYITRALFIGSKNDFIILKTNFLFLLKRKYV